MLPRSGRLTGVADWLLPGLGTVCDPGIDPLLAVFAAVPDITARVFRTAAAGEAIWSEWETSGTRRHKQQHLMRGVIIFGVAGERASWARLYLEPVDLGDGGIDAAIGQIVDGG